MAALIYLIVPGQWGFIDKKGNFVIKPQFESVAQLFLEDPQWPALVKKEGKWQYIDCFGKKTIRQVFDYDDPEFASGKELASKRDFASPFKEGIACVLVHGITGIMNSKGNITHPNFTTPLWAWPHFSEG